MTRRYPDDVEAWFTLGDAYYHIGPRALLPNSRYREAFNKAIELDPSYSPAYIHLIDDGFMRRDSAVARDNLARYRELNPAAEMGLAFQLMYDIEWGDEAERESALAALDTASESILLMGAYTAVTGGAYPWGVDQPMTQALESDRFAEGTRSQGGFTSFFGYLLRGRLAEAIEAGHRFNALGAGLPAPVYDDDLSNWLAAWGYIDDVPIPDQADPTDNTMRFINVARAGRAGRATVLDSVASVFQAQKATAESEGQEFRSLRLGSFAQALRVLGAVYSGEMAAAEAEFKKPMPLLPDWTHQLVRFEMGKTYLEAGEPLKAKAYFASLSFSSNSAVPAQYYLGEVHEQLGDGEQARLHYAQFLRWFEGADRELQPWVERARQALQRLAAKSAA